MRRRNSLERRLKLRENISTCLLSSTVHRRGNGGYSSRITHWSRHQQTVKPIISWDGRLDRLGLLARGSLYESDDYIDAVRVQGWKHFSLNVRNCSRLEDNHRTRQAAVSGSTSHPPSSLQQWLTSLSAGNGIAAQYKYCSTIYSNTPPPPPRPRPCQHGAGETSRRDFLVSCAPSQQILCCF